MPGSELQTGRWTYTPNRATRIADTYLAAAAILAALLGLGVLLRYSPTTVLGEGAGNGHTGHDDGQSGHGVGHGHSEGAGAVETHGWDTLGHPLLLAGLGLILAVYLVAAAIAMYMLADRHLIHRDEYRRWKAGQAEHGQEG